MRIFKSLELLEMRRLLVRLHTEKLHTTRRNGGVPSLPVGEISENA